MKKSIYVFSNGELKRKDNTLYVENENEKKYLPIETVSEIYLFGEITLNTSLLNFLSQKGVVLHYFNYYGYYAGSIYPRERLVSGEMTVKQVEHYISKDLRLALAKKFVSGALQNILIVLSYYNSRGKELNDVINKINEFKISVPIQEDIESLMGVEGNARDSYYQAFDRILDSSPFRFEGRSRRPPRNPLNSLISFGNSVMYTSILSEIYKTHLDPRIGYLHSSNLRRFSLNLDVSEIFKPIIVDRVIFTIVGKGEFTEDHFEKGVEGVVLNGVGREIFLKRFEEKMASTIKHKELGREVSYRRLIRMELYKLEKHFLGDKEYQPFLAYW
ncbi:MAG: subtype I-B CRISPR-associated endonuclease Cas1 [Thermoplasmatales archaeon B_DKE]|nr:MAG: subtype I-B CRISPR-associated endonuclease Cas1 [Thermoplasmatales archaeon B_DKE]